MSEQLKRAQAIVTAARQGEVEWTELEKNIAAELDTARYDLARKVQSEIGEPIKCLDKAHDDRWCPTCAAHQDAQDLIEKRMTELFTREQIDLGE